MSFLPIRSLVDRYKSRLRNDQNVEWIIKNGHIIIVLHK
jgi:hypothetical protein